MLSTSALLGIAIGNIFGGDFVKNGRRKTIIQFNILGLIGTLFTLVLDFYSMCLGRMIFGFASGILSCATPKMLDEVIPAKMMDKGFGTSTNILINLAFFVVLIMGIGNWVEMITFESQLIFVMLLQFHMILSPLNFCLTTIVFFKHFIMKL